MLKKNIIKVATIKLKIKCATIRNLKVIIKGVTIKGTIIRSENKKYDY